MIFFVGFRAIHSGAQGLYLALHRGCYPGRAQGTYRMLGQNPRPPGCKATHPLSTAVLLLPSHLFVVFFRNQDLHDCVMGIFGEPGSE